VDRERADVLIQRDKDKGLIDIACELRHETPRAYLVDAGEKEPVWVPKSQAEYYKDRNIEIITLPSWLAKEKGLI
jgi:hypothetical protein